MRVVRERSGAHRVAGRVRDGLIAHNVERSRRTRFGHYVLSLRDRAGRLRGGLVGDSAWNGFYVHLIWVDEIERGTGAGRRLMQAAERMARRHGCDFVWLSTYTFQAPGFYEKLGYRRFGAIKGFPRGASRFFYVKRVRPSQRPV